VITDIDFMCSLGSKLLPSSVILSMSLTQFSEPCQALAPELESAAETLSSKDIYISEIDCTQDLEICSKYDVQSYPTIRIFRGLERTPARYRGRQKAKQYLFLSSRFSI
jgi:protein disulfide-isomerase A1